MVTPINSCKRTPMEPSPSSIPRHRHLTQEPLAWRKRSLTVANTVARDTRTLTVSSIIVDTLNVAPPKSFNNLSSLQAPSFQWPEEYPARCHSFKSPTTLAQPTSRLSLQYTSQFYNKLTIMHLLEAIPTSPINLRSFCLYCRFFPTFLSLS